jgi:hypothetical protein
MRKYVAQAREHLLILHNSSRARTAIHQMVVDFDDALNFVEGSAGDSGMKLSNAQKLVFYGLFKQVGRGCSLHISPAAPLTRATRSFPFHIPLPR